MPVIKTLTSSNLHELSPHYFIGISLINETAQSYNEMTSGNWGACRNPKTFNQPGDFCPVSSAK